MRDFFELEARVCQVDWNIPYKTEESLGKCLIAAKKLAAESTIETDEYCSKFIEKIMPEAFRKILTTPPIQGWPMEIQEGIYDMVELFLDLLMTRLSKREMPIPVGMLKILAMAFDPHGEWNDKNRDRLSRGRWARSNITKADRFGSAAGGRKRRDSTEEGLVQEVFAKPLVPDVYSREKYNWLCDLINYFGEKGGFQLLRDCFDRYEDRPTGSGKEAPGSSAREDESSSSTGGMSSPTSSSTDKWSYLGPDEYACLIAPIAKSCELLQLESVDDQLGECVRRSFHFLEHLDEADLKSKDIGSVMQLLDSLKTICVRFWPSQRVKACDGLRLDLICRMLSTPHFSAKMNALKEVSRLIDESKTVMSYSAISRKKPQHHISKDTLLDWMVKKRVLSIALEGNIDQVQYTDRIKAIVEFLGPRLSNEELRKIWLMGERAGNAHVTDNIYGIMAGATTQFTSEQFEHLLRLLRRTWEQSNDRMRDKLLGLIGTIGKDAASQIQTSVKSIESILELLWEMANLPVLPKHLVESALQEQISILSEMRMSKDVMRKCYVMKCVLEIKEHRGGNSLFAVKHLHNICKTYLSGSTMYSRKEEKASTLGELNKQHEIVRLISSSLQRTHKLSCRAATGGKLTSDTLVDGLHTHEEAINIHLELLSFLLKEGELYLSWRRVMEIWDTLVDNPDAIPHDNDVLLVWLRERIPDFEQETKVKVFQERILKMDCAKMSEKGFKCFTEFFEHINQTRGKLKLVPKLTVENLSLDGINFLWRLIADCSSAELAEIAIDTLLDFRYFCVSSRLKANPVVLHEEFIHLCFDRLEAILASEEILDGAEIETSMEEELSEDAQTAAVPPVRSKINVSNVSTVPQSLKGQKLQQLSRILLLTERYISSIEETHGANRAQLPHAVAFHGAPLNVYIVQESKKDDRLLVKTHENELIGEVKRRISEVVCQPIDDLTFHLFDNDEIRASKNYCLVGSLCPPAEEQTWLVKSSALVTSSCTAVMAFNQDGKSTPLPSAEPSSSEIDRDVWDEAESRLPGVLMAFNGKVFPLLYKISTLNDNSVLKVLRRILHRIPTDPQVQQTLCGISFHSDSSRRFRGAANLVDVSSSSSPIAKPMKKAGSSSSSSPTAANLADAKKQVEKLFDVSSFRVLYNLEALSARLLPTKSNSIMFSSADEFSRDFLNAGGLKKILDVLGQGSPMPTDMDHDVRQSAYKVALLLLDHLLCGKPNPSVRTRTSFSSSASASPMPVKQRSTTSPIIKPTPPKRSALDSSAVDLAKSPTVISATKIIQTMSEEEFAEILSRLVKVTWAAAAGKLHLAAADLAMQQQQGSSSGPYYEHPRFSLTRRSRDSSTGSSGSESTSSTINLNDSQTLHAGVCSQQSKLGSGDQQIAEGALELLITCLRLRSNSLPSFYSLPLINDFIIEILLASPSSRVRQKSCEQLQQLSKLRNAVRVLDLDNLDEIGTTKNKFANSPLLFLANVIFKTPVPLWMPTCRTRGMNHAMLGQSAEYFSLRGILIRSLSAAQFKMIREDPNLMLDDELSLLSNFTPCRSEDCTLLAGHIRLVEALLHCDTVSKDGVVSNLIPELLNVFLFPAASQVKILSDETNQADQKASLCVNPKCDTRESRRAAYDLLIELARDCQTNLVKIVDSLVRMHHSFSEALLKDFEYEPAVARRAKSNFVGLKNAGATCYMNSVLQQLYCTPTVADQILSAQVDCEDEDSIFYQLQNVFGHLLESKLKFYEPDRFWKTFRLFGMPVNVREQQDAFEFFTQVVDQVDEYLSSQRHPKVFANRFEGIFSDQKICQGCPHRYEREQSFMALNVTVKCNNLQESLDQFVKGELLESDNAYFCEKCERKRDTIKRMCIRSLPQTLVIQLKRFNYEWETNRAVKFDDLFQFPWKLDMAPYTTEGIQAREDGDKMSESPSRKTSRLARNASVDNGIVFQTRQAVPSYPYELVGVVVHSGQANAGHYYSFIKDRRQPKSDSLFSRRGGERSTSSRWFKFNDTTVEEFEMNEEAMATECFGGSYRVKRDGAHDTLLPENRQRYWNAYMLVYESTEEIAPLTPKKTSSFACGSSRYSQRKISTPTLNSAPMSGPSRLSEPLIAPRESLSELSNLLEKGDMKSLFSSRMPAAIERGIQEENLHFLENRDVFSSDYYDFIEGFLTKLANAPRRKMKREDVAMSAPVQGVRLAVHFLLNSYLHLRDRDSSRISELISLVEALLERSQEASLWLMSFFASEHGRRYFKPFLLECTSKEVRRAFAKLVVSTFKAVESHLGDTNHDDIDSVLVILRDAVANELANNMKHCGQIFWVISKFVEMGTPQCRQMFQLNGFSPLIKFLLGIDLENKEEMSSDIHELSEHRRRWSLFHTKEFGELHRAIGHFISSCDLMKLKDRKGAGKRRQHASRELMSPPACVQSLLCSSYATPLFVRESVSACREVSGPVTPISQMLLTAAWGSRSFSKVLLKEILKQYSTVNTGELRNLSQLLTDLLNFDDILQDVRIRFIINGDSNFGVDGLLHLVKECHTSDSCRSYQCIKTLVGASNKSNAVKDHLLQNAERWQWCVNWLKSKMQDAGVDFGPGLGATSSYHGSIDTYMSNEDSMTRTFHRTTSAQVTLDEARAILAEFNASDAIGASTPDNRGVSSMETDDAEMANLQDELDLPELEDVNANR